MKYDDLTVVESPSSYDAGIYTTPPYTQPYTPPYPWSQAGIDSITVGVQDAGVQYKEHMIDWDNFDGIDIKIGNRIIHISKEDFAQALFKLFPNLTAEFAAAIFDRVIEEAK